MWDIYVALGETTGVISVTVFLHIILIFIMFFYVSGPW